MVLKPFVVLLYHSGLILCRDLSDAKIMGLLYPYHITPVIVEFHYSCVTMQISARATTGVPVSK